MKLQVLGKKKRKFWLVVHRFLVAAAAVIFVALSCNSTISVEINGQTYSQRLSLFEKGGSFEQSALFNDILEEELHGTIRLAVIQSQLETEGSYNGQKKVDVAEFAHRQEELPEATVSAPYYLDDLIKWGNYGFVSESVYGTQEELDSYFKYGASAFSIQSELAQRTWEKSAPATALGSLIDASKEETLSMRMIRELPSSESDYRKMAQELGKYVEDSEIMELNVLVPRYLSADGLDLAEYALTAEEYVQLREDLKTASQELFYNFTEYSASKGAYLTDASNVRYCIQMNVDGQPRCFTNLEENLSGLKIEEITRRFEALGSYMYYNADRAEITTNTGLTADGMKLELGYYQYAFGDNTRIWVGVDTSYPVQDGFWTAREAYDRLMPYYGYLAGACVLLIGLSLWILVRLTRFEGRELLPSGGWKIALKRCDRIPTEAFFVLGAGSAAGFAGLCYLAFVFCQGTIENVIHSFWLPFAAGAAAFAADDLCMFVYLSFVRRGKAHTLWKNSLLLRAGRSVKSSMLALYDNSHILVRALLPFLLLLAMNLVLGGCGVIGILAAAVVDVAAILVLYSSKKTRQGIVDTAVRIGQGDLDLKVDVRRLHGENRELAEAVNGIGDGIKTAVEKSMKDERLKADLITNVSHDIKTPLTSIINFVSLLKREKIENERVQGYIEVLDAKSQRLKQLTDDLVEASKISSGNISLQWERLDFKELVNQTCGEFADKFQEKCLEMVVNLPEEPVCIEADSRRLWRVVENLFTNAYKYALEGTRVYLEIKKTKENGQEYAVFSMKNISAQALNIRAEELTERFIRGDISRSTEGSGLGLSIAQNLTQLQKGKFEIYLDGDLFKVMVTFPTVKAAGEG